MEEKRKSPRQASLTRCMVDRLFAHNPPMPSRVINYSEHGLMIELDYQVLPGEAVAVKFSPEDVEAVAYGYSVCIGMVRWCNRQGDSFDALYGAGVQLASRCSMHVVS